jgi:hypothetical protein
VQLNVRLATNSSYRETLSTATDHDSSCRRTSDTDMSGAQVSCTIRPSLPPTSRGYSTPPVLSTNGERLAVAAVPHAGVGTAYSRRDYSKDRRTAAPRPQGPKFDRWIIYSASPPGRDHGTTRRPRSRTCRGNSPRAATWLQAGLREAETGFLHHGTTNIGDTVDILPPFHRSPQPAALVFRVPSIRARAARISPINAASVTARRDGRRFIHA